MTVLPVDCVAEKNYFPIRKLILAKQVQSLGESMSDRLTPAAEAARALRDVEQRRDQARASDREESRWVGAVFGVAIFAELAGPDFFGEGVRPWTSWSVVALLLVYMTMLRTRRGAAVLGRPTRVRRSEVSPRFAVLARLAIAVVMVLGFLGAFFLKGQPFPYAGTVLGALFGGGLIVFGRSWQRGLNSLAMPGRRAGTDGLSGVDGADGAAHGSR
jgi:hypothetical protein